MPDKKEKEKLLIPGSIKIKSNAALDFAKLTPGLVSSTFEGENNLEIQSLIDKIILQDPDLVGLIQTRKAIVNKAEINFVPASDDQSDIDICDKVREQILPLLTKDNMKYMLECNFRRFSVLEIDWTPSASINKLIQLPFTSFEFARNKDENLTTDLKLYNADTESYTLIPENKAIITLSNLRKNGIPVSIIRTIAFYHLVKHYNVIDWSVFNEKCGIPGLLGKYDPENSTQEDINRLYEAIQSIGSDAAGVISKNDEITTLESKKEKPDTFKELMAICDQKEGIAILGQHNTTGINEKGSRAALDILDQIKEDLIFADFSILETAINEQLINPFCYFNFNLENLPTVEINLPANYTKRAEFDKKMKDNGVQFNKDYFIKRYNLNKDDFEVNHNTGFQVPNSQKKTPDLLIQHDPYF
jgi:phage gp29-like protein